MNKFKVFSFIFLIFSVLYIAILIQKDIEIKSLKGEISKTSVSWLSDHQREVWTYVLEWCESSGITTSVNPRDNDNTPSFGAFQFKPDTFTEYAKKYGIEGDLMDYEAQRAILKNMLSDDTIKWDKKFPACIRKIGFPPVKF